MERQEQRGMETRAAGIGETRAVVKGNATQSTKMFESTRQEEEVNKRKEKHQV
jgi:hypothetical protein